MTEPAVVPWEDVKLALALLWQRAALEGKDGGEIFGWGFALRRLVEGIYEDDPEGDQLLVADMDARLTQAPDGDPNGSREAWHRSVATSAIKQLGFIPRGL